MEKKRTQVALKITEDWDEMINFLRYRLREKTIGDVVYRCVERIYEEEGGKKDKAVKPIDKVRPIDKAKPIDKVKSVDHIEKILSQNFLPTHTQSEGFLSFSYLIDFLKEKTGGKFSNKEVSIALKNLGFKPYSDWKTRKRGFLLRLSETNKEESTSS